MKKMTVSVLLFWILAGCATTVEVKGIKPQDVASSPSVFCKVTAQPDPVLMGGWKGIHYRFIPSHGEYEPDPVQYWLAKYGDQYGLYFYREKEGGNKIYSGWRSWTINGKEIHSDTGVRLFTQDGKVYFSWRGDKPTLMTPLELKK